MPDLEEKLAHRLTTMSSDCTSRLGIHNLPSSVLKKMLVEVQATRDVLKAAEEFSNMLQQKATLLSSPCRCTFGTELQ